MLELLSLPVTEFTTRRERKRARIVISCRLNAPCLDSAEEEDEAPLVSNSGGPCMFIRASPSIACGEPGGEPCPCQASRRCSRFRSFCPRRSVCRPPRCKAGIQGPATYPGRLSLCGILIPDSLFARGDAFCGLSASPLLHGACHLFAGTRRVRVPSLRSPSPGCTTCNSKVSLPRSPPWYSWFMQLKMTSSPRLPKKSFPGFRLHP